MNKFTYLLLDNKDIPEITPEDAMEVFRELKMLMQLGLKKKELFSPKCLRFILNPVRYGFKSAMYGLPQTDALLELSYIQVRDKIDFLMSELREDIDKINFDTISQYQNLAYRNNAIIQQLIDLGGEFRAYYEGQLVESKPLI